MNVQLSRVFTVSALISIVLLASCSTTEMITSQWSNPGYGSSSFKRILVAAVAEETSIRRNFEDEFVHQLRAAGIDALQSYRYLPEEKFNEVKLKQAAQRAGADGAILARSVSVEQKTEYGPSYHPFAGFGIFGRHVGASWYGPYGAPTARRYDVYTSETTLYDVTKNDVVWTGTVQATQPDNVNTAIKRYVETVIRALNDRNLLGVNK